MRPGEVIIDEKAQYFAPLHPGVVESPESGKRSVPAVALKYDWKRRECLLKITRAEQAGIPGERRIEVIDKISGKHVCVASRKRIKRLRRDGVKQRIDRICKSSLQARVRLKPEPRGIIRVNVVVDPGGLNLFVIIA